MIITIGGESINHVATGSASAAVALPTLTNGKTAKYILIKGTALGEKMTHFAFGGSGMDAPTVNNGYPVNTPLDPQASLGVAINVSGCTHFRSIASTGTSNPHHIIPLAAVASEGS